ncbi:hypothetical protein L211DRAFT_846099 [Terfezia boudieri ATCC MYA-4762]|uniref:Uncharacterized protein n=1 Tax=Terfezia boudieri ATCC MYA-4762 TaxID=1051890 RepID=A0A3N4M2G5_9PEZI|nr:hypothetical protein L211DRAFT_846099 [Terfezia boudieri ATCC MYA-4762]
MLGTYKHGVKKEDVDVMKEKLYERILEHIEAEGLRTTVNPEFKEAQMILKKYLNETIPYSCSLIKVLIRRSISNYFDYYNLKSTFTTPSPPTPITSSSSPPITSPPPPTRSPPIISTLMVTLMVITLTITSPIRSPPIISILTVTLTAITLTTTPPTRSLKGYGYNTNVFKRLYDVVERSFTV